MSTAERDAQVAARRSRLAANSAEGMAALRAAGRAERDPNWRNPDYMAGAFLSARLKVQTLAKVPGLRRALPAVAQRLLPGGYYYELARVKHIDRILSAELQDGLDQLAILGAGYDSRPYRFADALHSVRTYEVDLPAVSEVKQRKVARLLGRLPENVHYVTTDLQSDGLRGRLEARGYRIDDATLIILSGVTPYLSERAVERLLEFTGHHSNARTSIVFDYVYREMVEGDDSFLGARKTRRRLDALGEPMQFGIAVGGAAAFVERFGLELTTDLQPDDLASQYLRRADGSVGGLPYGFAAVAHARVAGS